MVHGRSNLVVVWEILVYRGDDIRGVKHSKSRVSRAHHEDNRKEYFHNSLLIPVPDHLLGYLSSLAIDLSRLKHFLDPQRPQ